MAEENEEKKEIKKESEGEVQPVTSRAVRPFDEMDRLFDSFFNRRWMQPLRWDMPSMADFALPEMKMPRVDVIDRENEVVIRAETPGVKKEDLDVSISENSVTIKGTTCHEEKEEKGDYFHSEISKGSFRRTVALLANVDTDKAKAAFNDGILELTIPKVEKSKSKTVEIE
ncbi:MAG: Hsp20 family protein [Gammaproteobacteria bacterium]|nr:Hsp20 family protein [Gammaproteobacteria bacterium]